MQSKFYLNKKGIDKGPYSVKQILNFVLKGQIQINENLYRIKKNKRQKSLPIYQNPEFKKFFPISSLEKGWFLLKKNQNDFIQSGPYLKKGLQILLKAGLVSDKDFVCTEGMNEWERLSLCSEFHTRIDSTLEDWMDKLNEEKSYPLSQVISIQASGWSQWRK